MNYASIIQNLQKQHTSEPLLWFTDFDGTLFEPNVLIIRSAIQNRAWKKLVEEKNIPFVIITGRPVWDQKAEKQRKALNIPKPDIIVAGAGSILYQYEDGMLKSDKEWENTLAHSNWDESFVDSLVQDTYSKHGITIQKYKAEPYVIQYRIFNAHIATIISIKDEIESRFGNQLKVLYSDLLWMKNTSQLFNGVILAVPSASGKENAVKYILEGIHQEMPGKIKALVTGDTIVDIPMLQMKFPHYVVPTPVMVNVSPFAKVLLQNSSITQFKSNGSYHIYSLLRELLSIPTSSAAQNNPVRHVIKIFEKGLNRIVDPSLNANQVSFAGVSTVKQAIVQLQAPDASFSSKVRAFALYTKGSSYDLFDGIRARNSTVQSPDGFLVDVFCDRVKEFMQIFLTVQAHPELSPEQKSHLCIAALSCILPSIARARVEMTDEVVSEYDSKGGSMLSRTHKLFSALWQQSFGSPDKANQIYETMSEANINTYINRIQRVEPIPKEAEFEHYEKKSPLQQKALRRWLLLITLLQEEYDLLLQSNVKYSPQDEQIVSKYIKNYISISTSKYIKTHQIPSLPDFSQNLHTLLS